MQRNVRSQCTFLECSANDLSEIADCSADVVITRAVLAYVSDKSASISIGQASQPILQIPPAD
jgi:hypothetical protein